MQPSIQASLLNAGNLDRSIGTPSAEDNATAGASAVALYRARSGRQGTHRTAQVLR
jgi:hypothetical protein